MVGRSTPDPQKLGTRAVVIMDPQLKIHSMGNHTYGGISAPSLAGALAASIMIFEFLEGDGYERLGR
jgi:hypothetical protein